MVSSTWTEITYRNVYCAICNGELHERNRTGSTIPLSFWRLNIRCQNETVTEESLEEFSLDKLTNLIYTG